MNGWGRFLLDWVILLILQLVDLLYVLPILYEKFHSCRQPKTRLCPSSGFEISQLVMSN